MCYMISRQGYLSDRDGHWHPCLMFFAPLTDPTAWGSGLPGSPILTFEDTPERLTVFLIPVGQWSDGSGRLPRISTDDPRQSSTAMAACECSSQYTSGGRAGERTSPIFKCLMHNW